MLMSGQDRTLHPTAFSDVILQSTGVRRLRNVRYFQGEERDAQRHKLDLYLPSAASQVGQSGVPLVIWIHGGGWRIGSKDDLFGLYGRVGEYFASCGIAWANINYRLTPRVQHPGHVEDCAAATRYLMTETQSLGTTFEKFFLAGHSAGAHLASLLALEEFRLKVSGVSSHLAGVIASSGIYKLAEGASLESTEVGAQVRTAVDELSRHPLGRQALAFPPDVRSAASPLSHVCPSAPPFMLIREEFGFPDTPIQMEMMENALRTAGVPFESLILPGLNHISMLGDMLRDGNPTAQGMIRFVRRRGD